MFDRKAVHDIKSWYRSSHRKPLIIRGARQVGKTTTVALAARELEVQFIRSILSATPV